MTGTLIRREILGTEIPPPPPPRKACHQVVSAWTTSGTLKVVENRQIFEVRKSQIQILALPLPCDFGHSVWIKERHGPFSE